MKIYHWRGTPNLWRARIIYIYFSQKHLFTEKENSWNKCMCIFISHHHTVTLASPLTFKRAAFTTESTCYSWGFLIWSSSCWVFNMLGKVLQLFSFQTTVSISNVSSNSISVKMSVYTFILLIIKTFLFLLNTYKKLF